MSYPGIQLLSFVKAARRAGLETGHLLAGTTEAELEAGRVSVPWDSMLDYYDAVGPLLSDEVGLATGREFITSHPLIRVVAQLSASVDDWLALFWGVSGGYTSRYAFSWTRQPTHYVLEGRFPADARPCAGYFLGTHFVGVNAPTVMGAEPHQVLHLGLGERHLVAHYSFPVDCQAEERRRWASHLPLATVLASLELLGTPALDALRDGHLVAPEHLARAVDEASQLSRDWKVTPTEARVALTLAEGRSPAEIAREFGVSVATVRVHLRNLYGKTATAGQRELADRVRGWQFR